MDEDLHNEDKYFKKAYRNFKEEPSAEVWENINARLTKNEAAHNSKRLSAWKRMACILLLLAGSAGAYKLLFIKASADTNISLLKKNETKNHHHQPVKQKLLYFSFLLTILQQSTRAPFLIPMSRRGVPTRAQLKKKIAFQYKHQENIINCKNRR